MIPRTAIPIGNLELLSALFPVVRDNDKEVADFEKDLASYLGAKKVFAVNSGRTALYLALRSLGLKCGENVIVPAYSCAIVFEVILRLGLKPTLVDVDPETYNINCELIPKAITSKTKAIIPVHLFGRPCEMKQIMEIASEYDLFVIEDAAQALGAEYKGMKIGTFGDLAIFSFGPGKSITSGEGGAIIINNTGLINKVVENLSSLPDPNLGWYLRVIKNMVAMKVFSNQSFYGFIRDYLERRLNRTDKQILFNCLRLSNEDSKNLYPTIKLAKLPSLSAKIARLQLKKVDDLNKKRIRNALILTKLLSKIVDYVHLPKMNGEVKSTFTRYPIRLLLNLNARDQIKKRLIKKGVDVETPYHYLVDYIRYFNGFYPQTEVACKNIITLPTHPCLTLKDLHKIAIALNEVVG
jgi:dTDP-4-amino-4,6-dideoxygalactose transaminase